MIPLIRQIQVKNYKSIGRAVVDLEPFTVFVGPNGAGKSNFLDALAFVRDCLFGPIELAFQNRGGIGAVRRRSGGHPTHIGIRLKLNLPEEMYADYSFEIAAEPREKFRVARERCVISPFMRDVERFEVQDGTFTKPIHGIRPKVLADRLALYAVSAIAEFRPVYDFLTSMASYSISPEWLRELQWPTSRQLLMREGGNAAAVLKRLMDESPERYDRLCRLLSKVVDGIVKVEHSTRGKKEKLLFKQDVQGQKHPWTFEASNMSDGTLRVLGLLLAVYQPGRPSVVTIEEPEATVNPAVTEIVVQTLMDASKEKQVLVTTHSPDILDYKEIGDNQIRVVTMKQGNTLISPLSQSSREAIREQLYTPGELLRLNELNPDTEAADKSTSQLNLFGPHYVGEVS